MSQGGWRSVYPTKGPGRNLPLDALTSWAVSDATPLSPEALGSLAGAALGDFAGAFFPVCFNTALCNCLMGEERKHMACAGGDAHLACSSLCVNPSTSLP